MRDHWEKQFMKDKIETIKLHIEHGAKSSIKEEEFLNKMRPFIHIIPEESQKIFTIPAEVGQLLADPNIQKIKDAGADPTTGKLFQANFLKRANDKELDIEKFNKNHLTDSGLNKDNDFINRIKDIIIKIANTQESLQNTKDPAELLHNQGKLKDKIKKLFTSSKVQGSTPVLTKYTQNKGNPPSL